MNSRTGMKRILVGVPKSGVYGFVDEDNHRYAKCYADDGKDVQCKDCGELIENHASCYRDGAYNYYCLDCIITIPMQALWEAYNGMKTIREAYNAKKETGNV